MNAPSSGTHWINRFFETLESTTFQDHGQYSDQKLYLHLNPILKATYCYSVTTVNQPFCVFINMEAATR